MAPAYSFIIVLQKEIGISCLVVVSVHALPHSQQHDFDADQEQASDHTSVERASTQHEA